MTNSIFKYWLVCCLVSSFCLPAIAQQPQYEIISLGLVGESVSGGQTISENGQFAGGFTNDDPFVWQSGVGSSALPSASGPGTSSGAFAIADDGTIIGRGMFNGQLTAFAMRPISAVPEPSSLCMIGLIAIAIVSRRRRD